MSATRCSELLQVGADISERKWRLFAVECCRAILPMCPKLWHRETFERSERIADSASPDAACEGISELYNEFTWRQRSSEWSSRPRWSRVGRREEESTEELIAAERALLALARWWTMARRAAEQIVHHLFLALAPGESKENVRKREEHDVRFASAARDRGQPVWAGHLRPELAHLDGSEARANDVRLA